MLASLLVILVATSCGQRNRPPAQLTATRQGPEETISLPEATRLVKTQSGGSVSCTPAVTDSLGRTYYDCSMTQGREQLACRVPESFFPSGSPRFPNAPHGPAVLCSPLGNQRSVIAIPRQNV